MLVNFPEDRVGGGGPAGGGRGELREERRREEPRVRGAVLAVRRPLAGQAPRTASIELRHYRHT